MGSEMCIRDSAYTPEKAQYIALYIKKAMHYGHVDPDQGGMVDGAMEKK